MPKKYDGELQQVIEESQINPNKLLEVRARASRNPEQDGYSGKASGPFTELVRSWLKVSITERKTAREAFQARRQIVAGNR